MQSSRTQALGLTKRSTVASPPMSKRCLRIVALEERFQQNRSVLKMDRATLRAFIENEDDSTLWHVLYTVLAELQERFYRARAAAAAAERARESQEEEPSSKESSPLRICWHNYFLPGVFVSSAEPPFAAYILPLDPKTMKNEGFTPQNIGYNP